MKYLTWKEEKITDFSSGSISSKYNDGFVFTRLGKGVMHQTRSCRINLVKFELTSENRRILKKGANVGFMALELPILEYDWAIGKLAKDFYSAKFGPNVMSAQKIKEMLTDESTSNFNRLFSYTESSAAVGFAICYGNRNILHYSYPFYNLEKALKDMGLIMMTKTIQWAKENGKKYIYLGSLQRPGDVYKLQFEGFEWFDGKEWKTDVEEVKMILKV